MITYNKGGWHVIMLSYKKFFKLAESKNLNIEELRKMFTPRTIYRLENGSEISIYIIEKICCIILSDNQEKYRCICCKGVYFYA